MVGTNRKPFTPKFNPEINRAVYADRRKADKAKRDVGKNEVFSSKKDGRIQRSNEVAEFKAETIKQLMT